VAARDKSWTARTERTLTRAEHPGTAVEWDGRVYEVRDAIPAPDGSVRYRLAPWEDRHAIRRMERYDALSEEIREVERRDRRRDHEKRRLTILLAPLAGLLPRDVQKRMERNFGAPSIAMTISSAAPFLAVGFLGLFAFLVGMAGGTVPFPRWLAPPLPIAMYFFLESAARLMSAVAAGEPLGSLAIELVYAIDRAVRGAPGGVR
jgi:hypothetical protein